LPSTPSSRPVRSGAIVRSSASHPASTFLQASLESAQHGTGTAVFGRNWLGSVGKLAGSHVAGHMTSRVQKVIARDQAPAAFVAWDALVGAVASTTPTDLMELAHTVARASLDPAVPAVPRSDAVAFAEQMVVDVASMTTDVRAAGLAELGAGAPAFVLAVWTEDMMIRADAAWNEMFGEEWRPTPTSGESDPWVAHERFLVEVAKLPSLDPVTSELVRLRGARAHDCRLCQSRRNVSAIDLAGRSDLFDDKDPSGISHAQALALQIVDVFVWQPMQWPPGLGEQVVDALGPTAATELILDLVRNAANKIAVAFNADDPQVETGVEYYDIDVSTGELRYDVSPAMPRA
jgi:hypothetical protein